jgi:Xaa-Pro aminopeptidase
MAQAVRLGMPRSSANRQAAVSSASPHRVPRVLPPAPALVRPGLDLEAYVERRAAVLKALDGAAGVVFAGDAPTGHAPFVADASFVYLTGITSEPGAALLFDPSNLDPNRRILLFLRAMDPELDRWDRYRDMISIELRQSTGFSRMFRLGALNAFIVEAARRTKRLAALHRFAGASAPVTPDLVLYRKAQERTVGVTIEDRCMLLTRMRAVKTGAELELLRSAASATSAGYSSVLESLRPGALESSVARTLEQTYIDHGASGHAYEPICGSGLNACMLHYRDNAEPCRPGELLLIDSGAKHGGYCCDVTRTIPVSGTFTPDQRELYQLVLRAQEAALKAVKPGVAIWRLDQAARDVIESAGLGDAYIHGIGHHLGLEVHDADPDEPLQAGHVITIEPGVYLPDLRIGIRIEDSVIVTRTGHENLTRSIPKSIADIEAAMKR